MAEFLDFIGEVKKSPFGKVFFGRKIKSFEEVIDTNKEEKILDFIGKTKNPYIFKVNGKLVKLEFTDNGTNAEDAIINVIKSIYK